MSEEGSVILSELMFPVPWPPKERLNIQMAEGFKLIYHQDGHLEIIVSDHVFNSQPLQIVGYGTAHVATTWTASEITLYINGQIVKSNKQDNEPFRVQTDELRRIENGLSSIEHPEAKLKCQSWISWRESTFSASISHNLSNNRYRLKTESEQAHELKNALLTLFDTTQLIEQGRTHLVDTLASGLRSLIFWPNKLNKSYNPLLLRLAALRSLPLPVFAPPFFDKDKLFSPELPIMSYHSLVFLSTQHLFANQVLIDLQEYLERPVLFGDMSYSPAGYNEPVIEQLIVKDLIFEISNKMGGSHYDADITKSLDWLSNFIDPQNRSATTSFLLHISQVVVNLGEYVLTKI